jgi:crossover junction endodeoxyribonuclease RusA
MTVTLPWPPKALSANSRKDRRYSTAERKQYKQDCWVLTKEAKFRAFHLDITFHPPDGRRRDLDNMLAGIKYGLDGVAAAMGIDDSFFEFTIRKGEPVRPHGAIVIRDGGTLADAVNRDRETVSIPFRGVIS